MGTDDGENLMDPGETVHENLQFLFFCAAVIQAVNKHQGLLRASIASPGQDHRLGANEAPPAIISIFLGAELENVLNAIELGETGQSTPESFLGLGTPVLPPMPMHGGDRNRTSPFAFTGNKFEFRALGSSMSLSLPNTVLNTIVAEAVDFLAEELEDALETGVELEAALRPILQRSYAANKQVVFGGDNYSEEWHAEAAKRGLLNLKTTPDALPYLISDDTETVFSNYGVLSPRELESRYEVSLEQYVIKLNIEAETAATIAQTMLLPAAARHKALMLSAQLPELASDTEALIGTFVEAITALQSANLAQNQPADDLLKHAEYIRDTTIPAMEAVRVTADKLEKVVADDIWPLPKYSEILFIK
jgi:glutamine synthetase